MSQSDTKERILDAAERLFARQGFHATSLRAITGEAEVNLAAVNYHFGSKEALLDAVFERRLTPLNHLRLDGLQKVMEEAIASGGPPQVESLLRAFLEPTMRLLCPEAGGGHFVLLVGYGLVDPEGPVGKAFLARMKPILSLLYESLCEALPNLPKEEVFRRLQFVLGTFAHTLRWCGRTANPQPATSPPPDSTVLGESVIRFATAGMEAP